MNWSIFKGSTEPASKTPDPSPSSRSLLLYVIGILIVAIALFSGFSWAKKTVTLAVDGEEVQVQTFARTVAGVIEDQNIQLSPEDRVTPGLSTALREGTHIEVNTAKNVVIMVDGKEVKAVSCGLTVSDALEERKLVLGQSDIIEPLPATRLADGMQIKVIRVSMEEETVDVPIEFPTERLSDPTLAMGITRVVSQGVNGVERQVWEITRHDGKEVNRRLIESKEVTPPVKKVVKAGTLQQVSRGGNDIRFRQAMEVTATAYTYTGRNTATGAPPRVGGVAVDTRVIPFGTRLYVEGYGYATAIDRGGKIKGNRIDVFLESKAECRKWGVRRVNVYILE